MSVGAVRNKRFGCFHCLSWHAIAVSSGEPYFEFLESAFVSGGAVGGRRGWRGSGMMAGIGLI